MDALKKIFDILDPAEQKKAFFLLFLILVMAFLDMLGVASILPFIAVLANPQLVETNIFLNYIYQASSTIGVNSVKQFLFVLGFSVFLFLMFSLTFRGFTHYVQVRFALLQEYNISKRLVEGYLHQPYKWFLNQHSADLGKGILSEVNLIIYQSILPMINLVSQIALSLAILVLLVITDPTLALSVGFFLSLSYGAVFYSVKKILSRIGSGRLQANTERFMTVMEAFNAVKEIKFGNLEQFYTNRFIKPALIYAKNQSLFKMISDLPRFFLEGIAFGGMIFLILVLMKQDDDFINIVPIIALYAFAGYRLLPAMQQIYSSLTQLRFSKISLDILHKSLKDLKTPKHSETNLPTIKLIDSIKLDKINFNYPNTKQATLRDINLKIPAFSKVGIAGTTGSGKTTTVDVILGLLEPSSGTLSIDEKVINEDNKRSWQKSIGYVPQQIYLADASIAANIAFGVEEKKINQQALENAAKIANLHEFVINKLPNKYNTTIGERGVRLSGGQRQRIGIARALYHQPKLLILDEATSSLDNLTEQAVIETINNLDNKITIILIAHRLSTIENCDTIFLLEQGKVVAQGTYQELKKTNHIFKKLSETVFIKS